MSSVKGVAIMTSAEALAYERELEENQKKVRQLFHNLYSYAVKYQIIPQK